MKYIQTNDGFCVISAFSGGGRLLFFCLAVLFGLSGCNPRIKVTKSNYSYPPLDYAQKVFVLEINDEFPAGAENLGTLKVGDTGFSTNCEWETVIENAKNEARKMGGNVVKIIEHKLPSIASSCHRITAQILRVSDVSLLSQNKTAAIVNDWDYALLHFYRSDEAGILVGYDIYLGESVICRAKSNWKTTVKVYSGGRNSIWGKTEAKTEIPVDIEIGKEYYIRCGISMGIMVGRPTLTLVDNPTGKREYNSAQLKGEYE
ncbi:MAG: hypothetical protein LBH60_01795 [Prevotellaceae bacterium]|jgi:hypothetical protein|nr:hypothetical protein [Prevotellaceae bacterium]